MESKFNNLVDIEKKYDASLEFILDAVKENEQEDFKKRWNAGWSCIQYKPAKRAIIEFNICYFKHIYY
ncbi:hypothetical protein FACS189416_4680 [Bacteroidia bacterium]|nr:hypothetical protein FACS189416_4680 [Bacteroidia bacterium]